MNIETASTNARPIDEAMKDAGVCDKHNEEYVESEVII